MDQEQQMTKEELEHLYSPSRWSPLSPPTTIITEYITTATRDLAFCRANIRCTAYEVHKWDDSDSDLVMDVYGEDLPASSALLVYVHGGYWQDLNTSLIGGLMGPLHRAGVLTVALPYTLAPTGSIPQMVREVARGIATCRQLARQRGARHLLLAGWSAGAQLVLQSLTSGDIIKSDVPISLSPITPSKPTLQTTAASTPASTPTTTPSTPASSHSTPASTPSTPVVSGIICFSGVYDLRPLIGTYVNDPLKLDLDGAWQLSPGAEGNVRGLARELSLITPVLLATAEHDSPAFMRQCADYAALLRGAGFIAVEEHRVQGCDHFRIVSDLSDVTRPVTRRLAAFVQQCIESL